MPDLLQEKQEHITILTMNRPERLNSMTQEMLQVLLPEAFLDFRDDNDAWVLIITGTGDRAFSTGADLRERDERRRAGLPVLMGSRPPSSSGSAFFSHGMELWKPTIAAINGWAVAGGCELACAMDLRILDEQAQMALFEVKRGMGAGTTSTKMQYIMPFNIGLEFLWSGEPLSAQRAYELGMVNKVVPKGQALNAALEIAKRICENAPTSVRFQKEMAYRALGTPWPYAMAYGPRIDPYTSEDSKEGARAFAEKRKPVWKGR